MFDFVRITTREKKDSVDVYPSFITYSRSVPGNKSNDLMIRGGDFYAVWVEQLSRWSTDENDVFNYIDRAVDEEVRHKQETSEKTVRGLYMWDGDSGLVDKWHKYCQRQMRDNYHPLDEKIIFGDEEITKEDYATKKLPYPCKKGSTKSWDKLMGVLYSPDELKKLEWAIGSICTGDSKRLQKFIVLYGSAGTGKSTFLNILQGMFNGYYSAFDAKALGQPSNVFALEPFKNNPLIAIQHDGDLSRIEDNTRLNSIVSHEKMTVNEKFKSAYESRFHSFLFMGTNSPVKITDAKSGLLRRLIDVKPTGNTLDSESYERLIEHIPFECGAIAYKCREFYKANKKLYDHYIPVNMLSITNDFYDFVLENSLTFEEQNYTTLTQAWKLYKEYCVDANIPYPLKKIIFKQELKNYFKEFDERGNAGNTRARNVYTGFVLDKFKTISEPPPEKSRALVLDQTISLLDEELEDCPAQYANEQGTPNSKWNRVRRKLRDIDTSKLHYVKVPLNHIVIDFDIPDPETGEKSYILNLEAASKFPLTYAELSKSGAGIHLHYIYDGDVEKLQSKYADHVEIKVFKGDMSLRRQLTKCNDVPIAIISGGLPTKGDEKVISSVELKDEQHLITMIKKCIRREFDEQHTTPMMNFIKKLTDEAYESGMHYDINNLRHAVLKFANESHHQPDYCIGLINDIHWASDDAIEAVERKEPNIIFLDIEVVPNLLLICWKPIGEGKKVIRMFNPSPQEVEQLFEFDIVGHNVKGYDNHILYGRSLGYSNKQCYALSKRIIKHGDKGFPSARNLSYADTLVYPVKRQGLKKWEIELGFPHDEMDIDWDAPLDESLWERLADYCENDVLADEAVWNATQTDFKAHQILATLAGGTVNESTNALSTKFVFEGKGNEVKSQFQYRDMGDVSTINEEVTARLIENFGLTGMVDPEFTKFDSNGMPVFPGYTFEGGHSFYRGEDPKEGGYVYSEPGMYGLIALIDVESQHPTSAHNENLWGDYYTGRFWDIVRTRLYIKHGDFEAARKLFDGKLAPYLEDESSANDLSNALKIVINSFYGMSKSRYDYLCKDSRNKDNIIAKRGALFMVNLKHEVQNKGFTVAHIKTDSIKIPDATPEIIDFVKRYGSLYGYNFDHEATYDRMCLVDRANYICKYADADLCMEKYGYIPSKQKPGKWGATGDKFRRPYIVKHFRKEPIEFEDLCEVKSVSTCIYLDLNEDLPDVSAEEKELKKYETKFRKGELSDTTFAQESERLGKIISTGHNYTFVGKVGSFLPVAEGAHGGILVRTNDRTGKYGAVEGTKGRRWLESEFVKKAGLEDQIDRDYYQSELDKVIDTIKEYGDYEWFVSDDPYPGVDYNDNGAPIYDDEIPFEVCY